MNVRFMFAVAVLAAVSLVVPAQAQTPLCCGSDNLQGPCWERTQVNLPAFPDIELPAAGICWKGCVPRKDPVLLKLGAPIPQQCGVFLSPLTVSNAAGVPELVGTARLDYTRTWTEVDFGPLGQRQLQVWRLLLKVDISLGTPLTLSCPVPSCLGPGGHPTAFFHGHVDYAKDCETNRFEAAVSMFHGCDAFQHLPVISATPGVFHPDTSYAVVAPDTAAMPFIPAGTGGLAVPAPPDGSFMGGIRLVPRPAPDPRCFTEERQVGELRNLVQICLCPLSTGPTQYTVRTNFGQGACGSSYSCVNVSDIANGIYWVWQITAHLGSWAPVVPGAFPGPEQLWVDEVFHLFHDGCSNQDEADMFYGVTTDKGFRVIPDPDRPWQASEALHDLASNWSTANNPVPIFPLLGRVFPTRHLIYENILP